MGEEAMFTSHSSRPNRRRGVIVVQVAVCLLVLLGFAALTVDVGAIYNARGDLQRTADAAALAAAGMLSAHGQGDPLDLARDAAVDYTGRNNVFQKSMSLDPQSDIVFGRAHYDADANSFSFTPDNEIPDAVRVRVRLTSNSPNGALSLHFSRLFGKSTAELSAEAIAIMVPRDIAIVADLSASHTDDSELRHVHKTQINMLDVWSAFDKGYGKHGIGDGIHPVPPGQEGDAPPMPPFGPIEPGSGEDGVDPGNAPGGGQKGPTWGWMYYWGNELSENYNPVSDPGLVYLPRGQSWSHANLATWYQQVGYSQNEINALMSATYDHSRDSWYQYGWTTRVAVALGLARWNSGMPGGLWEQAGDGPPGNGNEWVAASELVWLVDYPFEEGYWTDYIFNYVRKNNTEMAGANANFQYRFGLKTFINYLLERQTSHHQTSALAQVPTQPMQAVKDAVQHMMSTLYALDTDDRVSLEVYGTTARHEVDLTNNYYVVSDRLRSMQAAHYDRYTNIGGGLERGIEELTSSRGRGAAKKVIVLLTDGKANVNEFGEVTSYNNGAAYALAKAQEAAALGIRIFAVSVGSDADISLMQTIADIGSGEHFHAEGSIEEYSVQLDEIFRTIGGRRPVELIQ
jgi:Flp pilus assembly protein TadG